MKEQILSLDVKKHVKIYKLHELGLSNKEVAEAAETNVGHVYNVLKSYKDNPGKVEKANQVLVGPISQIVE